jgi:hypothetical protein
MFLAGARFREPLATDGVAGQGAVGVAAAAYAREQPRAGEQDEGEYPEDSHTDAAIDSKTGSISSADPRHGKRRRARMMS